MRVLLLILVTLSSLALVSCDLDARREVKFLDKSDTRFVWIPSKANFLHTKGDTVWVNTYTERICVDCTGSTVGKDYIRMVLVD